MFNNKIKKIIGQELHKYRCDRFLQLKTVATKTGIPWYVIDNMEIGSVRKWEYYRHLLEFYGKELKIELIERSGRIGNGTVKNGGGNDRRRIAEGKSCRRCCLTVAGSRTVSGFSAACSGKLPKGKSCRRCRLTVAGG